MLCKAFWHYRDLKSECWTSRHILSKKILNFFVCVEVRFFGEKWNIYEAHIFPRPLLQTCRLKTTSLCSNTRLRVNKNFEILIILIELNVNVCVLCAHPVMTSIILHTRRRNCSKNVYYALGFYVLADFFFAFCGAEKHVFHIATFSPTRYVLKGFRYLEVTKRVRDWNKVKISYSWGPNFNYANWKYQY